MHNLNFEKLFLYDAGKAGITVDATIRLAANASANFQVKIDTGAEGCIFARTLGEKIGIDIETGERQTFGTVTGSFQTFGHSVTLIVNEIEIDSYVFFAADQSFQRNILGRHGWLDRVIIGINDYDGKLYLSRYESE